MRARPFNEAEYATLSSHFLSAGQTRDRLILVLESGTGFRIQELLSITVGQVWNGTTVPSEIIVARRDLKGGAGAYKRSVRSRRVPLSEPVRNAIQAHLAVIGTGDLARPLFGSNRSGAGGRHEPLASIPQYCHRLRNLRNRCYRASQNPRWWRSHKDPFAADWPEIYQGLEADPDQTGTEIMSRLCVKVPGRYKLGQLRTLQRRLKGWRAEAVQKLVYDLQAQPQCPIPSANTAGGNETQH